MSKKLITACLGLLALAAFILPGSASASVITHPTGSVLNPANGECTGVKGTICITAHNVGNLLLWDTAHERVLTECTSATMTAYLQRNDPVATEIEGTIHTTTFTGTGTNGECTSTFGGITVDTNVGNGTPWCIKSGLSDTFTVRGNSCSGLAQSITFVLTSTTVGSCKYSRSAAAKGTFTTHSTGDAILDLNPTSEATWTKEEGGIFCPSSGTLDLTFTLETDNTKTEPLYIS